MRRSSARRNDRTSQRKPNLPGIARSLLRWYRRNGRDLPWRGERSHYRILVSEIMLQQTQVSRVLEKYGPFLRRFPTLQSLSNAATSEVIKAWQGMGYNNRAIRLQKLATVVTSSFKGKLPCDIDTLESLPGIGRYTSHALACFAFDQRTPVVDTNIARVLMRLHAGILGAALTGTAIWGLAEKSLPRRNVHDWNQALMDLGATICSARSPKCGLCPLNNLCPSAHRIRKEHPLAPRREPSRGGIPNRIYRGKVVETLRTLPPRASISTLAMARRIKTDFTNRDRDWFASLLRSLAKDGLIAFRGPLRIALPD